MYIQQTFQFNQWNAVNLALREKIDLSFGKCNGNPRIWGKQPFIEHLVYYFSL